MMYHAPCYSLWIVTLATHIPLLWLSLYISLHDPSCSMVCAVTFLRSLVAQTVIQQAKSALENTRLTGEPEVKESDAARSADQNLPPNQGFDMGQVGPLHSP